MLTKIPKGVLSMMMLTRMKPTVKFCIRFLYSGLGIAATVYFIREVSLVINVHDNHHFIDVINGDLVFIAGVDGQSISVYCPQS